MTTPQSDKGLFPHYRSVRSEGRAANGFRQAAVDIVERLILMYAVMIFCGIGTFGQVVDITPGNSNAVNSYSNGLFLVTFGLLTVVNLRKTSNFLPFSHLLLAFVALAAFSAIWSIDPGVTIRRVGTLVTTFLISAYLIWRYDFAKSLSIIGHALLLICVLSIIVAILLPNLGITQPSNDNDALVGTWKGVMPTKNSLGWTCIAGVQIYGWRFLVEPERRLRHFFVLALIIFLALETRSATALIGIVLSIFLLGVLSLRRWESPKRIALEWLMLGTVGLAIFAVSLAPADVLSVFGKDASLTGRVPLWSSLAVSIAQRPLLGYGYGAFWVNSNPEMLRIWSLNTWQPPNAHNGFIDLILDLGLVGLALAVLMLVTSIKRALSWCRQPDAAWATYTGCLMIVLVVTSLDETAFLHGGELLCLLFSFCYFNVIRAQRNRGASADPAGTIEPPRPALQRKAARRPFRL
jgi:exopolysaccharide production protein ExoQ